MGKKVVANKYIIKEGTLNEMGNKGYNLNLLKKQNVRVPDFYCFNSRAFEEALDFRKKSYLDRISEIDYNDEEDIKIKSDEIISKIKSIRCFELEDKINIFLREKFKEEDLFSIRSSSTYEDFNAKSNDRIFVEFSNIKRSEVFEYIRKCWYSVYSVKSLKYFHKNNINIDQVRMGVIIQKMEKSDISGIAYTSNPKGLINEMVISVGKGTCEEVLAQKIDTTLYHYNKYDRVVFYEQKNNSVLLEKENLKIIIEEVLKIEKSFGKYTEIQWNLCNKELFIIQAKKIESIDEKSEFIYLNNKDIVDKFQGVILPLTESFAIHAYTDTIKNIARRTTQNEEIINKYEKEFNNMICCVNGRMYCNVRNWNLFLEFIPQNDVLLPAWQEKMGFLDAKKKKPIKGYERKINGSMRRKIMNNSKKLFKNDKAAMRNYIEQFNILYRSFFEKYSKELSNNELKDLYKDYVSKILSDFDLTFINEIYTYMYLGELVSKLKKVKVPDNKKFITDYITDIYNNETEKFLRELLEISNMVDDDIKAKLVNLDTNPKVREFVNQDGEFSKRLKKYLDDYGDIVLDSLKLESTTFNSNPKMLIERILEYVENGEKIKNVNSLIMNYVDENLPLIVKKNTGIINRSKIKKLEMNSREVVELKEVSKSIRGKLYDMVRVIFNAISKNLYNEGKINSVSDIFYLTVDEIFDSIDEKEIDLKSIAVKRRQEYMCYFKLPSYTKLVYSNGLYNKYHLNVNYFEYDERKDEFLGSGYSAGEVEGEILVAYTKEDLKDVKGKIIVAETTDFGWFFDIALSAGIITEYGSMFSGTSVLTRDLKIPYVSGIKDAKSFLKTGDKVRLDGNTGKVTII